MGDTNKRVPQTNYAVNTAESNPPTCKNLWGVTTNMAATKTTQLDNRHQDFNVENLLNVRSKNHGHKPVNQAPLWSK